MWADLILLYLFSLGASYRLLVLFILIQMIKVPSINLPFWVGKHSFLMMKFKSKKWKQYIMRNLSIKAHLHCDKTIKANKLGYAWFCYWKTFDWKNWNLVELCWIERHLTGKLKFGWAMLELKGIWLEKLKFGWTLLNNGWKIEIWLNLDE